MDTTWAKHQLTHFLQLTELRRPPPTPGIVDMTGRMVTAARNDEIIPAAQVVEQILDRVLGDWRSAQPERMSNRWVHHREAAQRALAQLERDDEIRERLGDAAPQLDAGQMHPWVWQGARSLWQSRHYDEAVRAAAIKVTPRSRTNSAVATSRKRRYSERRSARIRLNQAAPVCDSARMTVAKAFGVCTEE